MLIRSLLILVCFCLSWSQAAAQDPSDGPLTNAAVVKLVKAGFKEKTIISIIGSRPARFDLSTDRMVELKRTGVSEKIILAMLARQQGEIIFGDEAWSDEPFYNDGNATQKGGAGNQPADGSTADIFGSSGGVRGSTKSRGGNGSTSGDTITTGSATVRILRPPAEAGGGTPKLEKTPSLTNDSIVELVEAGFSEGTIVRRIERSPVEFDLSPEKLSELRRRRVSEKILSAMKAAMGESSDTKPAPGSGNGTSG